MTPLKTCGEVAREAAQRSIADLYRYSNQTASSIAHASAVSITKGTSAATSHAGMSALKALPPDALCNGSAPMCCTRCR